MKKKMTLAFASSIFMLALAASPNRANAAIDIYLHFDDAAPKSVPILPTIVSVVASLLF